MTPEAKATADFLHTLRLRGAFVSDWRVKEPWAVRGPCKRVAVTHLMLSGDALLEPAGSQPIAVTAGDLAILPKGGRHVFRGLEPADPVKARDVMPSQCIGELAQVEVGGSGRPGRAIVSSLHYDELIPLPLHETLPAAVLIRREQIKAEPALLNVLKAIVAELDETADGCAVVLERLLESAYMLAIRQHLGAVSDRAATPAVTDLTDAAVAKSISLIHSQFDRRLTLDDLATHVGLSKSAFSRRFREATLEAPAAHLTKVRMQHAEKLLSSTDLSVEAIAHRVGYESAMGLHLAFTKRSGGVSPGGFRAGVRLPDAEPS